MDFYCRVDWLKTHFFADWMINRLEAERQVRETGLHEENCASFRRAVDARCVELMKDRLPYDMQY